MAGTNSTTRQLPRGIRNNNPGNIRLSSAAWKGKAKVQSDAAFVTFDTPEYGIRAMARILLNYQSKHKLDTIEEIIDRWAPPVENNTNAYIAQVARAAGVKKDDTISLATNRTLFRKIMIAIINHENGRPQAYGKNEWYDAQTVSRGIAMASGQITENDDRSQKHVMTPSAKVLKRGHKGKEVTLLQQYLNANGAKITEDGDFGKNTEQAVKDFQRNKGLSVDGKVGKNTRKALGMPHSSSIQMNMLYRPNKNTMMA